MPSQRPTSYPTSRLLQLLLQNSGTHCGGQLCALQPVQCTDLHYTACIYRNRVQKKSNEGPKSTGAKGYICPDTAKSTGAIFLLPLWVRRLCLHTLFCIKCHSGKRSVSLVTLMCLKSYCVCVLYFQFLHCRNCSWTDVPS